MTWSGFGALTSQSLRQVQIRGAGVSGPYSVGTGIVPGTEQVSLETRDLDNPERSLQTQGLGRLADYQIDYVTGTLLLKNSVPSADLNNNPVFIVVTFESDGGGESTSVLGLRAATDFGLGLTVVQDRAEGQTFEMLGADLRVQARNGSELAAEVAYTQNPDSAGLAVVTSGRGQPVGRRRFADRPVDARGRRIQESIQCRAPGRRRDPGRGPTAGGRQPSSAWATPVRCSRQVESSGAPRRRRSSLPPSWASRSLRD